MPATFTDHRDLFGERATAREDAGEAMRELLATAQDLVSLADRHDGDSGADPALIDGWTTLLESVAEAIRVHLGEPRVLRHGVLVPVGMIREAGR